MEQLRCVIPNKTGGFITLTAAIAVSAIGIVVATAILLLGVGAARTSLTLDEAAQSRALSTACAEVALSRLRLDETYAGNESIAIGSGSCFIETVEGAGPYGRTIKVRTQAGQAVSRLLLSGVDVTAAPTVVRWEEVAAY